MLESYFSVNWLNYIYNISSVLVGYTGALQGDKYFNFLCIYDLSCILFCFCKCAFNFYTWHIFRWCKNMKESILLKVCNILYAHINPKAEVFRNIFFNRIDLLKLRLLLNLKKKIVKNVNFKKLIYLVPKIFYVHVYYTS